MAIEKKATSTVATTNHTLNYDLPLWEGGDITSWIGNLNDAFNKIDSGIYAAQQTADSLKEIGDNLQDLFDQTTAENAEIKNTLQQINANINVLDNKTTSIRDQLTEVNEAITQSGIEVQAINARLESIEDDIGRIMQWDNGIQWTPPEPIVLEPALVRSFAAAKLTGVLRCGSVLAFRIVQTAEPGAPSRPWDAVIPADTVRELITALKLPSRFSVVGWDTTSDDENKVKIRPWSHSVNDIRIDIELADKSFSQTAYATFYVRED